MRAAFLQFDVAFGEKSKNLDTVEKILSKQHRDFDLLVLPELFNSGYLFSSHEELAQLAEAAEDGMTSRRLREWAQTFRAFIVAGIPERDGECIYNSAILVGQDGVAGCYRKIHLFDTEKYWFTPGNRPFAVFDIDFARIGIMICFDWISPESARSLALLGAEIICHPANLVLPYCQRAMVTRSIENSVFTITANRIGTEHRAGRGLTFTGASQILDTRGKPLVSASAKEECLRIAEIDPAQARDKNITETNHLFNDRRPTLYFSGTKK
ncbi:acyltransferase [candidate division KSB1 bacterium]|nr:acyltransferase [candidate division KSB1 bacterium]